MRMGAGAPLLDQGLAAFVQTGVAIYVAARGAGNVPALARASGCRVAADRRSVTVLLDAAKSEALLEGVRGSSAIAVVFSWPPTHRTIQLKGTDAVAVAATDEDRAVAARWADDFIAAIVSLGYEEPVFRALLWTDPADLVAVTFTPSAAFDQSPGPRAGEPLGAR
jgi:hypothetical protein